MTPERAGGTSRREVWIAQEERSAVVKGERGGDETG